MALKRAEYKQSTWEALVFYRLLRIVDCYYRTQLEALPVNVANADKYYQLEYAWAHAGVKASIRGFRKFPSRGRFALHSMNQYRHNLIEVFGDDAVNH